MTANPSENIGILHRIDLLVMLGAIVTLFLALANEPWWTLTGSTTRNLLSIQVSPFYLKILATGLPPTLPTANNLGILTRVIISLGFVALFAASAKPTAWWRNLAVYFGLASLIELYFSFIMIYYLAQTTLVAAYGASPPYYGTTPLQANVIGLDLKFYTTPLVTAAFTFPYYLGFLALGLVSGRSLIKVFRDRALQVLTALLPGGGVHDVYLTPPYEHVWFSSGDKQFNPLGTDPDRLNDDELLVSFQRLYQTVEPGGSLSIVLPSWATAVSERFQRLMPITGFTVESVGLIYRTPAGPENELRFRKPVETEQPVPTAASGLEEVPAPPEPPPPIELAGQAVEIQGPPVIEISDQPPWPTAKMSRVERAMVKTAISTITERREPIPYRELLNQVYLQLVDKQIDFDSARQIETTLLNHNGRELILIEEPDVENARTTRKWWLGDQHMVDEETRTTLLEKIRSSRFKLPRVGHILKGSRRPRYKPAENIEDSESEIEETESDANSESSAD